eukprot:118253-Amphidinium_carterae.1
MPSGCCAKALKGGCDVVEIHTLGRRWLAGKWLRMAFWMHHGSQRSRTLMVLEHVCNECRSIFSCELLPRKHFRPPMPYRTKGKQKVPRAS